MITMPDSATTIRPRAAIFSLALAGALAAGAGACERGPAGPLSDSATVVIRLGADTVAVERWERDAEVLEGTYLSRSPRTETRTYRFRFDDEGRVTHFGVSGEDGEIDERPVSPVGAVPVAGGLYGPYAVMLAGASRAGGESETLTMLAGEDATEIEVRRVAEDSYVLPHQFGMEMTARVDSEGRLLSLDAGGGTTVERVEDVDFEELAGDFAARDERGEGLGPLSPRDSAEARVAGARIVIEYGRPSARGREVMGGLVPYGEVWRTGANQETRLTTDRALDIGGVRVEPGSYSIFTIPEPDRWLLIINSETGQGGLAHDAEHDVGRAAMMVRTLAHPVERFTIVVGEDDAGEGMLRMMWDDTEAYVPLRVPSAG